MSTEWVVIFYNDFLVKCNGLVGKGFIAPQNALHLFFDNTCMKSMIVYY